jgi:hypothetical protein
MTRRLGTLALVLLAGCPGPSRIEGTEPGDCTDGADNDADGAFDCDDTGCTGAPACRAELDAGAADAGAELDAPVVLDTPPALDVPPMADAPAPTAACVAFASELAAGLSTSLGTAVNECGRGACISCALASGRGTACGTGGTLASCIVDCIETNDAGACEDGACSAAGTTCDTASGRCRSDAASAVRDAITAGTLDLACTGCFAAIADCIASEGCLTSCAAGGCACDRCQCDAGCDVAFTTCSGLPAYLDCEEVTTTCGP